MEPSPTLPIPILCGGHSDPAIRRATTLCDGWINTGSVQPDVAFEQVDRIQAALKEVDRPADDFCIYLAVRAMPDVDLFRRFEDLGVTDLLCAPWMSVRAGEDDTPETIQAARVAASEQFAEQIIAKMG